MANEVSKINMKRIEAGFTILDILFQMDTPPPIQTHMYNHLNFHLSQFMTETFKPPEKTDYTLAEK